MPIKLKDWISSAEEYYKTAQFLENPVIEVQLNVPVLKSSWYLLHLSLELFLKAVLINYDKFGSKDTKIHDLKMLLEKVSKLDPRVDEALKKNQGNRALELWIRFINPFGFPNGGLRYLQEKSHLYAAPLGISHYFNELVEVIKLVCDPNKEFEV